MGIGYSNLLYEEPHLSFEGKNKAYYEGKRFLWSYKKQGN